MSTFLSIGYSEISPSPHAYLRPPSSLSLPSNSGDSGFLPSRYGSATASTANSHAGISSTSCNTSVGSSPIPTEQDIDEVLRKAVELLTLRNEALKNANAFSKLASTRNFSSVSGFNDFEANDPAVDEVDSCGNKQTNHLRSKRISPCARKSLKPDSYKTVMCQAWLESGICSFAENCRFAHGEEELRPCKLPTKNPKYKTKLCDKYTKSGLCPHGDRCLFIHPEAPNASNPYIHPDRYSKMQYDRTLLASVNSFNSETSQISLSNHVRSHPPPSWPLESPAFFSAHRDLAVKDLDHKLVLSDITNQNMVSVQVTPSVSSDSNSKLSTTKNDSPDSGISPRDYESLTSAVPQPDAVSISSDYPFQFAINTDNLARSLACEFKID